MKHKLQKSLIQIYTGDGKGKTTAAIGLANRAAAHGLKVNFIQFLKSSDDKKTIRQNNKIIYKNFGLDYKKYGWLSKDKNGQTRSEHLKTFQQTVDKAWLYSTKIIETGECDLLILDELNLTIFFGLLSEDQILSTLKNKPTHLEIVITGRKAPKKLLEIADLVTEMKEIKHPYSIGLSARKGIDY